MKKITKILSLVLALTLAVMSFSFVTVNAEDNYTLTITNSAVGTSETHNYSAYQIFTGTASTVADSATAPTTLSNVVWGAAVTNDTKKTALAKAIYDAFADTDDETSTSTPKSKLSANSTFEALVSEWDSTTPKAYTTDAAVVAEAMALIPTDAANKKKIASVISKVLTADVASTTTGSFTETKGSETGKGSYTASNLAAGYYLVLDASGDGIALQIVGNTTIDTKGADTPTVDKDVAELADNTKTYSFSKDEVVPFTVTVNLPSNLAAFNKYDIKLADDFTNLTLVKNLNGDAYDSTTLSNNITATLYTSSQTPGTDTGVTLKVTDGTTPSYSSNKLEIQYSIPSANVSEDYADGKVVFTYYAKVTAVETYDATQNKATINYANSPSDTSLTGSDDDIVKLYQYAMKINKVKADGTTALGGALFKIYSYDTNTKTADTAVTNPKEAVKGNEITTASDTVTTFYFDGLSTGAYLIEESTIPDGYNKAENLVVIITESTEVDNAIIKVYKESDYKTSGDSATPIAQYDASKSAVDNDTTPVTNIITSGTAEYNLVNKDGSTLPSTGGMGTKVIYTLGAILVVGAAVLLIVRRRMSANN